MKTPQQVGDWEYLIKSGDTLSAIAARVYEGTASQTKQFFGNFYLKKGGQFIQVDPDKLYSGLKLYHRAPGKAGKAGSTAGPNTGGRPVSDGVRDPKPRFLKLSDKKEQGWLDILKKDLAQAVTKMNAAVKKLEAARQSGDKPTLQRIYDMFVLDVNAIVVTGLSPKSSAAAEAAAKQSADARNAAKSAVQNYKAMLQWAATFQKQPADHLLVQDSRPKTHLGHDVVAYASYQQSITFWVGYFKKTNQNERVGIIIHELAHVAGADHGESGAINNAYAYADYATG